MKKVVLVAAILLAACATMGGEEQSYNLWEPAGKNDRGTFPIYRVKEMPNGDLRSYEYGDPFEWKYKITPNGGIYEAGDPFTRIGNIKNGVPMRRQKGGE